MAAVADDFDEVHLPVDITIESYDTILLLISSNEPGVLMPAISALREKISDESMVLRTISRIVELANTFKNDQVLIVISWYLAALANVTLNDKHYFDILSQSGAVPHIVKFASAFDSPSLSERCFESLVALAQDPVTSREIIANGALEAFKEALKRDDQSIQSQVSLALFRMSTDFENRRAIQESGLFDALIEFLASEDVDEEVLSNALQATSNIISDHECALHFEEKMGWNSIFPYLEDSDKNIQTYAYAIVAQISSYQSFQYHFDDELLQKFINALQDLEEFDPVLPYLLIILRNCCQIPLVSRALSQQVPLLIDRIFSSQTNDEIKQTTAEILAKLSVDPNTHSALLETEQLQRLSKLLRPEFPSTEGQNITNTRPVRKSIVRVLDSVCENRSIRGKLHEYGAIEQLVNILHETVAPNDPIPIPPSESPRAPPPAPPPTTKLGKQQPNTRSKVMSQDKYVEKTDRSEKGEKIEKAEKSTSEEEEALPEKKKEEEVNNGWTVDFQMIVLPMMYKMIGDSKLQSLLIERSLGDIEQLISSEYPDVLNTALLILATLAIDDAARENIANRPQFLKVLISLIGNRKVAIRRNALHAINSLAMIPKISIQLCSFGLIEKLKRFAASSQMINLNLSAFATNTLETLCNTNIVAKYWVKDVVDFTDPFEDGFYSIDPRSDRYRSIDDLLKDVIHLRIEDLLLDQERDEGLKEAVTALSESFAIHPEPVEVQQPKKNRKQKEATETQPTYVIPEWPQIVTAVATFVINRMGGPFKEGRIAYESEVSRCKYKTHSDVVMLGQLQVGEIRHRALLFKYLSKNYGFEVSIKRNRDDLSCIVKARKGSEVYNVSLTGNGDVITPSQ